MLPNTKIKGFAVAILIIIYLLQTHTTQHFTHKKYIVPCGKGLLGSLYNTNTISTLAQTKKKFSSLSLRLIEIF